VAKPKPLRVIQEQLNSRRPSIAEHEHIAGEGIRSQNLFADSSQTISSTAEIGRFHGNENAHLGSELNHPRLSHNVRLSATRSAVAAPRK
jgi:hypothetical protein